MFKLMTVIVPSGQGDAIYQAAKDAGAPGGTIIPGRGTAPSSVLSLLGFGDSSKEILLTVVPENVEAAVREEIIEECQKKKGRAGVLFTIDTNAFIKSGSKSNFSLEEKSMPNNNSYQMINVIVNKGYAEDAMAAARSAGAGGGTVVGGRGTAKEGDEKFFGVEIVPEKEMLIILAPNDKAPAVVEAIQNLECLSKGGSGVIFTATANDFSLLGKK
ncbi:MAG: transcriptional regulator [Treponema sp.]|nr:transcriptional regulator [Treponema sp.]